MDIAADLTSASTPPSGRALNPAISTTAPPSGPRSGITDRRLTRLLDIVGAALILLFVAPMFLLVAAAVALERDGPVFFRQARIGLGARTFQVFKFRTMVCDAEARLAHHLAEDPDAAAEWASDHKLRRDPRCTRLGRFLRRSSLDELPQLFNIFKGEMSLVGPRPIVAAEVVKYGRRFGAYTSVKPGLTGRWQVSGRNDVAYPWRVRMDAAYARKRCFALDIQILFATVPAVLKRRGSY